jgi:hypothetical protein
VPWYSGRYEMDSYFCKEKVLRFIFLEIFSELTKKLATDPTFLERVACLCKSSVVVHCWSTGKNDR